MSNLNAGQVLEVVEWMENAPGLQGLLEDSARRDKQVTASQRIDLPDHVTRGGITFAQPGSRPGYVLQSIVSLEASYPTKVVLSVNDDKLRTKGDKVKKWLAIVLGRLNEGGGLDADSRYHQGSKGWSPMRLECLGPPDSSARAGDIPWKAHVDDVYSLSFPNETGSSGMVRPSKFGRRFTMTVEEATSKYTKAAKRAPSKHDYAGKELKNTSTKKGSPYLEWKPITTDVATRPRDGTTTVPMGSTDQFTTMNFVELDDGETTYIVCENDGKKQGDKSGTIVWQRDNWTQGTAAVIVAGHTTPSREPRYHYEPSIFPLLHASAHIDFIRTVYMTKSINSVSDVFVEQNPEFIEKGEETGILQPSTLEMVATGAPGYVMLKGKPYFYNRPKDDELQVMLESWTTEADRYSDTHLSVTTADVLEKSTLGAVQLALGQRAVQQTRQLQNGDRGKRNLLLYVIESFLAMESEVTAYARGGELAGDTELTTGTSITLTKEDLLVDGETDWFEIDVVTASLSPSEQRMLLEAEALAKSYGVSTYLNMLDIVASDREAAVKELSRETVREAVAMTHTATLVPAWQERLRLRGGIMVQAGAPQVPLGAEPPQGQQPRPTPTAGAPAMGGSAGAAA